MKILIVDDEQPARRKVRALLQKQQGITEIMEADNGVAAVTQIHKHQPDLVFLDIQMPGMTGFEVIRTVGLERMPVVVFVTAYDQHALEAFEVQAVDYLLKPYDADRFRTSFQRAVEQVRLKQSNAGELTRLMASLNQAPKYLTRIMVASGSRFYFVRTDEIFYFSAEEKYVRLHTATSTHLVRETMTNLEQKLAPDKFARIHRSFIVNLDFIKEMQPWSHGDCLVVLKNGAQLNLSRRYRDRLEH